MRFLPLSIGFPAWLDLFRYIPILMHVVLHSVSLKIGYVSLVFLQKLLVIAMLNFSLLFGKVYVHFLVLV
jgi:hypothetical protein